MNDSQRMEKIVLMKHWSKLITGLVTVTVPKLCKPMGHGEIPTAAAVWKVVNEFQITESALNRKYGERKVGTKLTKGFYINNVLASPLKLFVDVLGTIGHQELFINFETGLTFASL